MAGDQPTHRIIRKNAQTDKWENIGACWDRGDGKMRVNIELVRGGEKVKGLLVKNEPKKPDQTARTSEKITGTALDDNFENREIPF